MNNINDHQLELGKITKRENTQCLHDQCTKCHGTGKDNQGRTCVHNISCNCSKCSPTYYN